MRTLLQNTFFYVLMFNSLNPANSLSAQKNSVFEEILTQSVLIESGSMTGTGFLYKYGDYLYLITARYVIVDTSYSSYPTLVATFYPQGNVCGNPVQFVVDLEKAQLAGVIRFATSHDFIFIELGKMKGPIPLFEKYITLLSKPFYLPKFLPQGAFTNLDSLAVGQEAFLFGYPLSLKSFDQVDFRRPIMRVGTIAGRSCVNKGNRPKDYRVLIDARVDKGMSGGFVMIKTNEGKYSLIGVMIELVPLIKEIIQGDTEIKLITENSGFSILLSFDTIVSSIADFQKER